MDLSHTSGVGARPARGAGRLAPGTRLGGGRYTVGQQVRQTLFAELYEATDSTTGNGVSIHLLDPRLAQSRELLERMADDARLASAVAHKNLAQVIELAVEGQHTYLATEIVEGHSLRELLDRKRQTGTVGFGGKGALNIATHVSHALSAAEAQLPHGAVSLEGIAVSRAGRVRVADLSLAAAVPVLGQLGVQLPPTFAPEVLAGARPTAAAGVYGLGAVLYEVLVGAPAIKGCKRPSEALPGIPPALDQVIARSMSPRPDKRYASAEELRDAFTRAAADAAGGRPSGQQASQSGGFPAQQADSPLASISLTGSNPGAPSLAEKIAEQRHSGQMGVASAASAAGAKQPPVPSLPMTPALVAAMADTQERWLISKGKLDYGPFHARHMAEQIQTNQIVPGNIIIDTDSGTRKKAEDHPLFGELVEAAKQRRDEQRRTQAEVQHAATEKRRGATLYVFIGLGVLALGGGVYFLVTKLSASKKEDSGAIVSLEGGTLQAKISFPSREEQKRRAKASRGRKSGGGVDGTSGSWDDSLNLDMTGDEDDDGGSGRLSDGDVNPVIAKHGGALGGCLTKTGTHNANIEFHVKPTGKVYQVRVNGQTGSEVSNCVRGVMFRMQFPTFNGVRSKHYFDMQY
jgi:serine/threonine protein kinase